MTDFEALEERYLRGRDRCIEGMTAVRMEKLYRLLEEAAQVSLALDRADVTIIGGFRLFRDRRRPGSRTPDSISVVRCKPDRWRIGLRGGWRQPAARNAGFVKTLPHFKERTVYLIHGRVEVQGLKGYCPACRQAFFTRQRSAGV